MAGSFAEDLDARLAGIAERGLLRSLPGEDARSGPDFSSNDYLGLSTHPAVCRAAAGAVQKWGMGSGGSRLISGNTAAHVTCEEALAEFKNSEAALCFSTGYAAAVGTIPTLMDSGEDVIILDHLAHACLVDAARQARAVLRVFHHNDVEHLSRLLAKYADRPGRRMIVTEAVFSMDGDAAPLRELVELKERSGAILFVDEAHATGVLGPGGRGLASQLGVSDQVDVSMGTLGKALGCAGGFICGSRRLVDYLVNAARSFIFSTAPPAAVCEAVRAAVGICASAEGDALRERMWENARTFVGKSGFSRKLESAIFPVVVSEEARAVQCAKRLREKWSFFVPAIRFPTVPRGEARLRVTINSALKSEEILDFSAALKRVLSEASSD